MSHELREPTECRAVRESRFEGVKPRNLQAADQVGVDRRLVGIGDRRRGHVDSVPTAAPSTEVLTVQVDPLAPSACVQTLDWDEAISRGLRAARLTHGEACALMVDDDGKPLDQSLWSRMRRDGNLPIKRMRKLPLAFWWHFIEAMGEPADMLCSHADVADLAVIKVALAFEEVAHAFRHMRRHA